MTATTDALSSDREQAADSHFRPDIQGLRAVAVLLVLFYHGTDGEIFPGGYIGVDVFFVISGFLITGHLIRSANDTGRVDLMDFYARRIRRILPAATAVLLFTAVATLVVLPVTRWGSISVEIVASSLYAVNWIFALNTNYLNADAAPSPLQHFWTLAVEEQFYIIWPAIIVALLYFARSHLPAGRGTNRRHLRAQPGQVLNYIAWAAVAMTLISLAVSVLYSSWDPARAYFVTPPRLWELGIGAIVATFAHKLGRIPPKLGYFLGAIGLIAIVISSLIFDSSTVFPGYAALLPTLGTAAVVVGGMSGRAANGVGLLLRVPAMQWIGNLSYSLYLWHWPLIVFGTYLLGGDLNLTQGLAIALLSIFPAWISSRYVEMPFRSWSAIKGSSVSALKFGALLMTISAVSGIGVRGFLIVGANTVSPPVFTTFSSFQASQGQQGDSASVLYGAEALVSGQATISVVETTDSYYPAAVAAKRDLPVNYSMGCQQSERDIELRACVLGDRDSDYTVALVGDSHADHWVPAVDAIAKENGWRLETYTKSSCPLVGTAVGRRWNDDAFYPQCYSWNKNALDQLTGPEAPDHVLVSSFLRKGAQVDDANIEVGTVSEGYAEAWGRLKAAGVPVTVLLDTPFPRIDIPECVVANENELSKCAIPREEALENGAADQMKAAEVLNVPTIDMTDYLCGELTCPAVIGGVLVYRDANHLTATYSRSLAVALEQELRVRSNLRFEPE